MEMDSDRTVEDNANRGKRKRSPAFELYPAQEPASLDLGQEKDIEPKDHTSTATKKQRIGTNTPETGSSLVDASQLVHRAVLTLQDLPIEVLQHVMSFVNPFSLGKTLCLNRYFYSLLVPLHRPLEPAASSANLPYLEPESIWSLSRKTHVPSMPQPLKNLSELGMFRLVYGRRCQLCQKLPKAMPSGSSTMPWNSGPGPTGVRTIWPYKVKACADCLKPLLLKETDLMQPGLSHVAEGLLPASFTPSLHYVTSMSLTQTTMPSGLQITKYYYRPQVDELLRNAPDRRSSGEAEVNNWRLLLDASRQESLADTIRMEAWELSQKPSTGTLAPLPSMNSRSSASGSSVHSDIRTRSYLTASSGGHRPFAALSNRSGIGSSLVSGSLPRQGIGSDRPLPRTELKDGVQSTFSASRSSQRILRPEQLSSPSPSYHGQGSDDIAILKAQRKADIEQRCRNLDPPIPPSVLNTLPAFHAALQVLMPLDETAWESLRARLLAQQEAQNPLRQDGLDLNANPRFSDSATVWREVTPFFEPVDIDLGQEALRPVREKLRDFAREYIHRRYADGTNLTYGTAPQFAADVLVYVRHRFYQNQLQEDAVLAARGQPPPDEGPSGIRARQLKLDHMRHVFENSVKPYTEFVRKDLFLCSACDTSGRHFAFEAIIQHYASKHTDAFSRGNAVVYWKAAWPEQPPFEPNPGRDSDLPESENMSLSTSRIPEIIEPVMPSRSTSTVPAYEDYPRGGYEGVSYQPIGRRPEHLRDNMYQQAGFPQEAHYTTSPSHLPPGVRATHVVHVERTPLRHHVAYDSHSSGMDRSHPRYLNNDDYIGSRYHRGHHHAKDVLIYERPQSLQNVVHEEHYVHNYSEPASRYLRVHPEHAESQYASELERDHLYRTGMYTHQRSSVQHSVTPEWQGYARRRSISNDHRGLDSPQGYVETPSTSRAFEREARSTVHRSAFPDQTETDAQRFLESIDSAEAFELDKPTQLETVSRHSRPRSRDAIDRGQAFFERRPNISQLRSRTPDASIWNATESEIGRGTTTLHPEHSQRTMRRIPDDMYRQRSPYRHHPQSSRLADEQEPRRIVPPPHYDQASHEAIPTRDQFYQHPPQSQARYRGDHDETYSQIIPLDTVPTSAVYQAIPERAYYFEESRPHPDPQVYYDQSQALAHDRRYNTEASRNPEDRVYYADRPIREAGSHPIYAQERDVHRQPNLEYHQQRFIARIPSDRDMHHGSPMLSDSNPGTSTRR